VITLTADTDLAALLRDLLRMGRMSQADLSRATGYTEQQICGWCNGRRIPDRKSLLRIADALGYDLALIPREDA
jgi:transcriptional regulator with XRE-family HTH domain